MASATGKISPARRLAFTRFVRRVLLRFRTLGLTAPGQILQGLPADFAILPQDMPDESEDTEAGRDLPDEVMRELCAHLDELEAQSNTEVRVATELLIDTGRRPDEINTLPIWRESGVGAPADCEELPRTISRLEQQTVDLPRLWRSARPNWRLPGRPTAS
ncbi:hypothetical protein [Streptomyces afghaniensis]|uniref:hypothetical protein n=1 Tax=Streptomyces afghaniensis TaxID=66865 RepID=UPI0037AB64A1